MTPAPLTFSFDAETDGLYGPVWAIGAVVLRGEEVVATFAGQIDPEEYVSDAWVQANVVSVVHLPMYVDREVLLDAFWSFWMEHRDSSTCVSDFGAPVEAGLFRACVEQDPASRTFQGPYPMHELGTALLTVGLDADLDRREMAGRLDLDAHNPLHDAIASGICWQRVQTMRTAER